MEVPSPTAASQEDHGHHRRQRHKRRRSRWKRHLWRRLGVGVIVFVVLAYVLFLWYMAVGAPSAPSDIPR